MTRTINGWDGSVALWTRRGWGGYLASLATKEARVRIPFSVYTSGLL